MIFSSKNKYFKSRKSPTVQEHRKGYLAAEKDNHKVLTLNMAVVFNERILFQMN